MESVIENSRVFVCPCIAPAFIRWLLELTSFNGKPSWVMLSNIELVLMVEVWEKRHGNVLERAHTLVLIRWRASSFYLQSKRITARRSGQTTPCPRGRCDDMG